MKLFLTVLLIFCSSFCFSQTVWLMDNDAKYESIKYDNDICDLLHKTKYQEYFKKTDVINNPKIKDGDYFIYYFYMLISDKTFGSYTMYKVRKNEGNIELIFISKTNIFLFTPDYYDKQIYDAKNQILDWCKDLKIIKE